MARDTQLVRMNKKIATRDWKLVLSIAVLSVPVIVISILSFGREFFAFGVETDYLGSFQPDAQRILEGQAPHLNFHPPLYPITLALFQFFTGDWFLTGRLVSLFSAIVVLATTFALFRSLLSLSAAWGALIAFSLSSTFLTYSAFATSDLFFLALYTSTIFLAYKAHEENSTVLWSLAGIVAGCAILSRTNGLTLALIAIGPWLAISLPVHRRLQLFGIVIGGILLPLIGWRIIAFLTGAPVGGGSTYLNLALTYFSASDDRVSGDALNEVQSRFSNLWQVLAYDPFHILRTYAAELYRLPERLLRANGLLAYPINLLAFPAVIWLALSTRATWLWYILVLALAQVLLLGFKAFDPRFYLFLLPLFGAALGEFFAYATKLETNSTIQRYGKPLLLAGLVLLIPIGSIKAIKTAYPPLHSGDSELSESVPKVMQYISEGSAIVSRKPHLPFYAGAVGLSFPDSEDLQGLATDLRKYSGYSHVFVYFGANERRLRPQFSALDQPQNLPEWLIPITSSQKPGKWALFEFSPIGKVDASKEAP